MTYTGTRAKGFSIVFDRIIDTGDEQPLPPRKLATTVLTLIAAKEQEQIFNSSMTASCDDGVLLFKGAAVFVVI